MSVYVLIIWNIIGGVNSDKFNHCLVCKITEPADTVETL